ncbi:MAG: hypothetical protein ABIG44_11440 [Planctomycetota bacterium]
MDILRRDPDISPLVDNLVGTTEGQYKLNAEKIVDGILLHMDPDLGQSELDVAAFDECYARFEESYCSSRYSYKAIAPLVGFTAPETIILDSQTEISRLKGHERDVCLSMLPHKSFVPTQYAIKATYEMDRIVGDPIPSHNEQMLDEHPHNSSEAAEHIQELLRALGVFKKGNFSHLGIVCGTESWIDPGYHLFFPAHPHDPIGRTQYALTLEEGAQIPSFCKNFGDPSVKRAKWLDVAIRRFDDAIHRARPEDGLLDLMIAAEALFLSDIHNAKERGELRYRLSLRAAVFLTEEGGDSTIIYNLFRKAYDNRSAIVHGDTASGAANLLKTADEIEDQLRRVLRKSIDKLVMGCRTDALTDWNSLIFRKLDGR